MNRQELIKGSNYYKFIHLYMTFKQLADNLELHILDLIPDDQADSLEDVELFECDFTEGLIQEGLLSKDMKTVLV